MDVVAYNPLITHLVKYLQTAVGRDKIYRTLQYWARFYSWYLYRKSYPASVIAPYNATKVNLGIVRKALRVGKNIEHFKAAAIALRSPVTKVTYVPSNANEEILRYLAVGRQLGYAGYLTFDIPTYLHAAGIKTFSQVQKLQKIAFQFWLAGLLCNIASAGYTLQTVYANKTEKSADEKKKQSKELYAVKFQLVQDVFDALIPAGTLGYLPFMDEGLIGIAGVVSSLMGGYTQWIKTK